VVAYTVGASGWTDDLTKFSEETGGAKHYMDVASRANATNSLKKYLSSPKPVLMDIGCSSGFMLHELRKQFPGAAVLGSDYVRGPLDSLARDFPEVPLLQFDLVACPLPAKSINGITLLNVIEHIEDDVTALEQVFRILKPGGVAVVEAPAGPGLYDIYDKELMHFRRYKMSGLLRILKSIGFEILQKSHLGFFVYPAFAATKKWNRRYLSSDANVKTKVVASSINRGKNDPVLYGIMRMENLLRPFIPFPFGIRCVVTCRRPVSETESALNG